MNRKIHFRLLEGKAPVTTTYAAQTQSNEQNTHLTATNKAEKGLNYEMNLNRPNTSTMLFAGDRVIMVSQNTPTG
jgi:outer membrane lipoprotein-sorting protein